MALLRRGALHLIHRSLGAAFSTWRYQAVRQKYVAGCEQVHEACVQYWLQGRLAAALATWRDAAKQLAQLAGLKHATLKLAGLKHALATWRAAAKLAQRSVASTVRKHVLGLYLRRFLRRHLEWRNFYLRQALVLSSLVDRHVYAAWRRWRGLSASAARRRKMSNLPNLPESGHVASIISNFNRQGRHGMRGRSSSVPLKWSDADGEGAPSASVPPGSVLARGMSKEALVPMRPRGASSPSDRSLSSSFAGKSANVTVVYNLADLPGDVPLISSDMLTRV